MCEQKEYRYTYTFDAYITVQADSLEEAQDQLRNIEVAVEVAGHTLSWFDAYGITDNKTGEEIREVS